MPRLLIPPHKAHIQRHLQYRRRPRHKPHLARLPSLPLRIVQKMLRVGLCPCRRQVQTGILRRPPAPDHRRAVLVVPGQPRRQPEPRRNPPHLVRHNLREPPHKNVLRHPRRRADDLRQPVLIIIPVAPHALVIPGVQDGSSHARRSGRYGSHHIRRRPRFNRRHHPLLS